MAIAGRVAMIPKGDYDATVTYQILDVVRYNDASYVAKKSSTGILPTDTEYWMLMTQDGLLVDDAFSETSERPVQNKVVNEAIQNIINGTTPVGDSNKLGGKGASEYALLTQLFSQQKSYEGLDFNNIIESGLYCYGGGPVDGGCSNYPISGTGLLIVYYHSYVTHQKYITYDGKYTFVRARFANTAWSEWRELATTADLANYLPLTGGTIESSSVIPFGLKHLGEYGQYIAFSNNLGKLGHLGVDANKKPYFKIAEETANYELLHSGNVGSYALSIGGGTLIGNLGVGNGHGRVAADGNHIGLFTNPIANDDNNWRSIAIVNSNVDNIQTAFRARDMVNGVFTEYILHHDGNSAKVAIQSTAPTDTTALWVDTANNKVKAYKDGAWTALA